MVTTAGELLECVSGQSWASFLRARLLQPIGMSATLADPRELDGRGNVSTPHMLADGELTADPLWNRAASHAGFQRLHDAVAPTGAMQSNVTDMASFVQMFLDEGSVNGQPLLKPITVRTMLALHSTVPIKATPQPNLVYPQFYGSGLGWQLRDHRDRRLPCTSARQARLPP